MRIIKEGKPGGWPQRHTSFSKGPETTHSEFRGQGIRKVTVKPYVFQGKGTSVALSRGTAHVFHRWFVDVF